MPRIRRLVIPNTAMHITCRANNKQSIFTKESDKLYYYSLLLKLKEINKITIFHYCLMNNHVHLIVWLNNQSKISRFMKQVNLSYSHYYSKKYDYYGHLWQGRFNSNIIDTDSYLLQCGKYIELNPVRAGVVSLPQDYVFGSYNHYAKGKPDSLITDDPLYLDLSDSKEIRRKRYVDFIIDSSIINSALLAKQFFIGNEVFLKKMEECSCIKNERLSRGRPKKRKIETSPFFEK